jgi:hypothetical protein
MTKLKAFYSFHYVPDCWRAATVRNIGAVGAVDGNQPVSDNEWEKVKQGGDAAIKKWIADQLTGKDCAVVLIGSQTSERKWVIYEIEKAWNDGKGVVGIHIHNLKTQHSKTCSKGKNPLDKLHLGNGAAGAKLLSSVARTYDPPAANAYQWIADNIEAAVKEAINIRKAA